MFKDNIFTVEDDKGGGYAEPMDWLTADELARDESQNEARIIRDVVNNKIVAIYHNGIMYVATQGRLCEHCGKPLDADTAIYSHGLTGHWFCSEKCGIKLGILVEPSST